MRYLDDLGSDVTVRWAEVLLVNPWYQHPLVGSGLVSLLLFGLGLTVAGLPGPWGRWLPIVLWLVPPGAGFLTLLTELKLPSLGALPLQVSAAGLGGWLGSLVFLSMALGLVEPRTFRLMARIGLFETMAAAALVLPWVRRSIYQPYVTQQLRLLAEARPSRLEEKYVELPVEIEPLSAPDGPAPSPVAHATRLIHQHTDPPPVIWIEGPGGPGKSALLRAIVHELLTRFQKDGASPLPVFIKPTQKGLRADLREAPGRFAISERLLEAQLLAHGFLFVIDGLSESELERAQAIPRS